MRPALGCRTLPKDSTTVSNYPGQNEDLKLKKKKKKRERNDEPRIHTGIVRSGNVGGFVLEDRRGRFDKEENH